MGAKIAAIEYSLPESVLTNDDLVKIFPDWDAEIFEQKIGIKQRHLVDDNETAYDLALKASAKVFKTYDKHKIDFIILCTQSPDYVLPTTACILQDSLGLRTNIGAFDFSLGCSGFIYGLALAKGLIEAHIVKTILLITSETYSKHLKKDDTANRAIFGDGAAAIVVEYSEDDKIFNFELGTDGRGYQDLIVRNGGMRHPKTPDYHDDNYLAMNGPEIFNFTIRTVPAVTQKTLEKNRLTMDDVDYVIFHQANKFMLDHLRRKIDIPAEKFHVDLLNLGNTVSATIPIAIKELQSGGKIQEGNKLLLIGFGVGLSWGGVVIEL